MQIMSNKHMHSNKMQKNDLADGLCSQQVFSFILHKQFLEFCLFLTWIV